MSRASENSSRGTAVVIGLILLIMGIFMSHRFLNPPAQRYQQSILAWFFFIGPTITSFGIVIVLRGLAIGMEAFSRNTILLTGILMLFFSIILLFLSGAGEGMGMLYTVLFVLVLVPGLILTIIGFIIR